MNKTLEEFKELRIVYSGRIDEAIKNKDKKALLAAKMEYKKILEKYMNFACQFLSQHTNRPLTVVKKRGHGLVLRSGSAVLKDTSSIRTSLNFIKLPDRTQNEIKTALDVIEDYYNKIIDESVNISKDDTRIKFQIIFGMIMAPAFLFIIALLNCLIIKKAVPDAASIVGVRSFYEFVKSGTNVTPFSLLLLLDMISIGLLCFIFNKQAKVSILSKKKFIILPVALICLMSLIKPYILINNSVLSSYEFDQSLVNGLNGILLLITAITIYVLGIAEGGNISGEYKTSPNILDIIMLIIMAVVLIIIPIWKSVLEFIDLSVVTDNNIYYSLETFSYWKYILWFIYIGYFIYSLFIKYIKNEDYPLKTKIIVGLFGLAVMIITLIML